MRSLVFACAALLGCRGEPRPPDLVDGARTPDGAPDGAPDAAPDAANPDVRVHVPADLNGIIVLFYGPDNQLVAQMPTPAGETAVAPLPLGGTVIAIYDAGIDDVRAIFGVQPGDDLQLGPLFDGPLGSPPGDDPMTITVPSKAGAAVYRVASPCGYGGAASTAVTMFITSGCQGPLEVLAQAEGADYQFFAAQRGTVSLDGAPPSGTLSGPWLDLETVTVSVTAGAQPLTVGGYLSPMIGDRGMNLRVDRGTAVAAGATGTMSFAVPPASIVDGRGREVVISRTGLPGSYQSFSRLNEPTVTAEQLDFSTAALPWYGAIYYDVAARKIMLPRTGGAPLDGQLVLLRFQNNDVYVFRNWQCVVPPDWTEVTPPELPAEFSTFDPGNPVFTSYSVIPIGISASTYQGYADFRRRSPPPLTLGSTYDYTSVPL